MLTEGSFLLNDITGTPISLSYGQPAQPPSKIKYMQKRYFGD